MTLTIEDKEKYVELIEAIWGGAKKRYNKVDNITEDVVIAMNTVLTEITRCSQAFALMHDV